MRLNLVEIVQNITLKYKQRHPSTCLVGSRALALIKFGQALAITACLLVLSACSWQGGQQWRRSVCEELVNADERERCLEEAMQSEGEYKEKVRQASDL